ncbi:hypothetical protein AVEN_269593-1 [Araneus ventricosus]|uniref:Uncharacterized protein n=1 Tax=Araneus ventricosus TaxID=182803 RepID=A0A4Y2CCN9_ARAVE|nr:hypothetical protein AVEN_269593-1 [Araneus ventricosus]
MSIDCKKGPPPQSIETDGSHGNDLHPSSDRTPAPRSLSLWICLSLETESARGSNEQYTKNHMLSVKPLGVNPHWNGPVKRQGWLAEFWKRRPVQNTFGGGKRVEISSISDIVGLDSFNCFAVPLLTVPVPHR